MIGINRLGHGRRIRDAIQNLTQPYRLRSPWGRLSCSHFHTRYTTRIRNNRIAVKIIDDRGIESLKILELEQEKKGIRDD